MSFFITGTDTGVGKTFVSCALLHAFAAQDKSVVGFKPVAAGSDNDDLNADAKQLRSASNILASYGQINPYCFAHPLAPHIAARNSGVRIELSRILTSYRELVSQADVVVVEGAGGFLVPLNDKQDSAEMAQHLALPVIVVVGMRLGCLNHALMTMRMIADCELECAGWVANVIDVDMPALQHNIDALSERIEAPLLGVVPFQDVPDPRSVAGMLNIDLLKKEELDVQTV